MYIYITFHPTVVMNNNYNHNSNYACVLLQIKMSPYFNRLNPYFYKLLLENILFVCVCAIYMSLYI